MTDKTAGDGGERKDRTSPRPWYWNPDSQKFLDANGEDCFPGYKTNVLRNRTKANAALVIEAVNALARTGSDKGKGE